MTDAGPDTDPLVASFEWQGNACRALGSEISATLLFLLADDLRAGGITRDLLPRWDGDANDDAVALRLIGGLHYAALTGHANRLADFYPSTGGTFRDDGFWAAVEETIRSNQPILTTFLEGPPQTNEVRRSAVLLGGFLTVAQKTGLPLRCLEIAASAGLNQNWDQFHYTITGDNGLMGRWGNPASPVQLESEWTGPAIGLDIDAVVTERAGCDISPIDLSNPETATRMASYVWPDQLARFRNLNAAIEIARAQNAPLDQADAAEWTKEHLAEARPGAATVVYHSIAQHYFSDETRNGLKSAMESAGATAAADAPVAWLRMEFAGELSQSLPEIRLQIWPNGEDRVLATVHPHGNFAHWQ